MRNLAFVFLLACALTWTTGCTSTPPGDGGNLGIDTSGGGGNSWDLDGNGSVDPGIDGGGNHHRV